MFQRARFSADGSARRYLWPTHGSSANGFTGFGGEIKLWDVKNGRELRSLTTTEILLEFGLLPMDVFSGRSDRQARSRFLMRNPAASCAI